MRILQRDDPGYERLERFFTKTVAVAQQATCTRSQCGAIIVTPKGDIIGEGYNSPPGDLESQRRCTCEKSSYHPKVVDKTCCMHAEERAILDALDRYSKRDIQRATMYFVRLGENGELAYSGAPYCTLCSKLILDIGIATFVLWYRQGPTAFDAEEYNNLSYQYDDTKPFA